MVDMHRQGNGHKSCQARCMRDLFTEVGCTVSYIPAVVPPAEAATLFSTLSSLRWRRESDDFGQQSRETLYFGDPDCDFAYVGLHLKPRRWPQAVLHARDRVAKAVGLDPKLLTGCLLNNYKEGDGFIPWHWDEVRAHGEQRVIATLSLGGNRRFNMRRRQDKASMRTVDLEAGSVLLMAGRAQEVFEHELPLRPDDPHRISLTFRSIVPRYETDRKTYDPCTTSNEEWQQ